MYTKGAELKAGFVMLLAVAALLGILFLASDDTLFGSWRHVHIRFEPGSLAPKEGDPVLLNGVRVGSVEEVRLASEIRTGEQLTPRDRLLLKLEPGEDGTAREIHLRVLAKLRSEQVIPVGTYAEIGESITGSVRLHLKPGISDRNRTDEDTKKDPIPGVEGTNLAQLSEKLGTLIDSFGKMAESGGEVLLEAKELLTSLKAKVDAIDATAIGLDMKQAVASLRRVVEGVEAKIGSIVENVDLATADLKAMAGKGSALMDDAKIDVKDLLETLKGVAKRLDALLERAGPQVDAFLASMTRAAGSFDKLAKDLGGVGPDARVLLKGLGADVTELMATLQDTAHNLLDTSEDVKSRPWILLNEPDEKEIAFENVRIATQNYAKAMQEMNSAAERLVKLSQSPNVNDPETRRLIQESLARFRSSQERYQRVEQALLQALQQTAPPPNKPR